MIQKRKKDEERLWRREKNTHHQTRFKIVTPLPPQKITFRYMCPAVFHHWRKKTCTYICTFMHAHTHNTHAVSHTYMHPLYSHTHAHTHTYSVSHIDIHTYTYYTHAHVRAHTHTHTQRHNSITSKPHTMVTAGVSVFCGFFFCGLKCKSNDMKCCYVRQCI